MSHTNVSRRVLARVAVAATWTVFAVAVAVAADEEFGALVKRLQGEKASFAKRQQDLLATRYDLGDQAAQGVTMSRGKPVQEGVRVRLPKETTWEKLASMTPDEIKAKGLWPRLLSLPHPHHGRGRLFAADRMRPSG
jgi:hypothetical protein